MHANGPWCPRAVEAVSPQRRECLPASSDRTLATAHTTNHKLLLCASFVCFCFFFCLLICRARGALLLAKQSAAHNSPSNIHVDMGTPTKRALGFLARNFWVVSTLGQFCAGVDDRHHNTAIIASAPDSVQGTPEEEVIFYGSERVVRCLRAQTQWPKIVLEGERGLKSFQRS